MKFAINVVLSNSVYQRMSPYCYIVCFRLLHYVIIAVSVALVNIDNFDFSEIFKIGNSFLNEIFCNNKWKITATI